MLQADLQKQRDITRYCNEQVLTTLGFRKLGNTSLYQRGMRTALLSPGISKGIHEKYWFDIREANLNKLRTYIVSLSSL